MRSFQVLCFAKKSPHALYSLLFPYFLFSSITTLVTLEVCYSLWSSKLWLLELQLSVCLNWGKFVPSLDFTRFIKGLSIFGSNLVLGYFTLLDHFYGTPTGSKAWIWMFAYRKWHHTNRSHFRSFCRNKYCYLKKISFFSLFGYLFKSEFLNKVSPKRTIFCSFYGMIYKLDNHIKVHLTGWN